LVFAGKLADGETVCELECMKHDTGKPIAAIRMRRNLDEVIAPPRLPDGVHFCAFDPARAPHVHELLALAYAQGGGSVGAYAEWWRALVSDAEFDPSLCLLACDANGALAGVAQCWTSAFVKDLAVHPRWRRRGVGRALLLQAFAVFKHRGAHAVDLKVEAGNDAAVALYQNVGMRAV
jgi:GNAT superfamily N-acetyltransferase